MKTCQPCAKKYASWSAFVRHMATVHGIDRENLWRRANQVGDAPCVAVRSLGGRWALMAQGQLL